LDFLRQLFSFPKAIFKRISKIFYRFGLFRAISALGLDLLMTAIPIEPLRKLNADGVLYTRLPEIEAKLSEFIALTPTELLARCEISDRNEPGYVPGECLMTLMRQYRSKQIDSCGQGIFNALMDRVLRGLPDPISQKGDKENLKKGDIQEEARYHFLEMLMRDRQGDYVEGLDFYEIRFARALKMLRIDAEKKVNRRQNPLEPLEIDEETGDCNPEVEKATAMFAPFDPQNLKNSDYRSNLDAAISDLPEFQKAIVEMIRKGIPIESKEPGIVNISNVLKRTPKTIATHRDKAYAKLRSRMTKGEDV
jgi:hypothetical protein